MTGSNPNNQESLILDLYKIGAIKFGCFTLRSGIESPIYIDLRIIISHPKVLIKVSEILWEQATDFEFQTICGVPYTALPIATCICTAHNVPMLIRRKEAKDYGTKKILEGNYTKGSKCLIVEDVVTTGSSVQETANILIDHGLQVTDAVVLLDRQQGGSENLKKNDIKLRHVLTLSQIVSCLSQNQKIDESVADKVNKFLNLSSADNSPASPVTSNEEQQINFFVKESVSTPPRLYTSHHNARGSYKVRAEFAKNRVARKLFEIMEMKQSNLCLSADVESSVDLLELVDLVGPLVCVVKTHIDILDDFSPEVAKQLGKLAQKHNFLLFEDRKYADIGNTVKHQYAGGSFRIADWADVVNAHSIPGPGVVAGLKAGCKDRNDRACLLIAEMSSKGNLAIENYTRSTVQIADQHQDFVIGFICTSKVSDNPAYILFTPGVKLQVGTDSLGQQYLTPDDVIRKRGCDVIIVGRGITDSENRYNTAIAYRNAGWSAYMTRCAE